MKTQTVLVVDCAYLMCQFLYNSIKSLEGYDCVLASDINRAEGVLNNKKIDCMIIDTELGDESGLAVVKKIRAGSYEIAHDLPIIIFTSNSSKESVKECITYSVSGFLVKPISHTTLRAKLLDISNKKIEISPPSFFQNMLSRKACNTNSNNQVNAKIAKTDQAKKVINRKVNVAESEERRCKFINWPANKSTGYAAIDRRLKNLNYAFNELHWCFYVNLDNTKLNLLINGINRTIDDTFFIATSIKNREEDRQFFMSFEKKLTLLNSIKLQSLSALIPESDGANEIFKQILCCWLALLSKQIFKCSS